MPAIQCPTCQKEYRWKPELAGKRVQCKCGETITVPAEEPQSEKTDLYDLVDEPAARAPQGVVDLQSAAVSSAVALADDHRMTCPYCGETVDGGSTMCVFCGSSLEGVAAAKPKPAQAAMQAAPPVATRPVAMRAPTVEEKQNKVKLIVAGIVLLLLIVGAVIGLKKFSPKSAAQDQNLKPADAALLSKIEDENGKEARDWLNASPSHMMGGWSKKQAMYHVDELYQMGAKKIYAFGAGYSMTIAIELPDDAAKRKALFDWQKKWHSEMHVKADTDQGQKFLEIQMRP
jgi:hypothetical protein